MADPLLIGQELDAVSPNIAQVLVSEQHLNFALRIYDTHQTLVRQVDTKASVMVGVIAILLTTTLSLAKDVPSRLRLHGPGSVSSITCVAAAVVFVSGFLWTAWRVERVLLPRTSSYRGASAGLMYASDILLQKDALRYSAAVATTPITGLLDQITTGIYQISDIYVRKTQALRSAHLPILVSLVAWSITAVLVLYILGWK